MSNEKKALERKDWVSSFVMVGKARVNDYTFKIDERSEKSNWIYNSMNLGIDAGEKHGICYAELMGGYSENGSNVIYAHGKDENGNDDFKSQIQIDWDDRFDEGVLESVGDRSFITVGLELTDKGKVFYKKFLSAYDAIAYIRENLHDGAIIRAAGNLKYSLYQDRVQVRKQITSIVLSNVEDQGKFSARFTQSILLDKSSASLKNIDKGKSVLYVDARVLDYVKELDGVEIKGQYPFPKQFEFAMDFTKPDACKKIMEKLFKVKKDLTQITFEGCFVEGGAVAQATWDDLPDDIKELVEMGVYSEEEALARCATNGNREQRMVLMRPLIRMVGEDKEKVPVVQMFPERYTESDLDFSDLFAGAAKEDGNENEDESGADDGLSWLENL